MTIWQDEKHITSDERRFVRELANADMLRLNRIRHNFRMKPIDTCRLLELYIESARVRSDWGGVRGSECIAQAEQMLAALRKRAA